MADADDPAGAEETARRKGHASRVFKWEVEIARNSTLHRKDRYALPTAVLLRDRIDPRTGKADVSQLWLSRALSIPPRSVVRAIGHLVEAGHLRIVPGRHRRSGNQYEPLLRASPDSESDEPISDAGVLLNGNGYRTPASHKPPSKKRPYVTPVPAISDAGDRFIGHGCHPDSSSSSSSDSAAVLLPPKRERISRKNFVVTKAHESQACALYRWLKPKTGGAYAKRRWAAEFAQLEADGLPSLFIVTAFRKMAIEDRVPNKVSTLRYFRDLALELKASADMLGERWWEQHEADIHFEFCEVKYAAHQRDPSLPSPYLRAATIN